jgi:hypothetical protein
MRFSLSKKIYSIALMLLIVIVIMAAISVTAMHVIRKNVRNIDVSAV